ncbi:2-oxoacid:acceptor oxidoreductase subunit alpha [Candidatus Marsarchaeota archaeon]|nr:2-oxoacid:acceptor oxidoreductase subunit alpha [Candidatus Marsarchaeota archaeon]
MAESVSVRIGGANGDGIDSTGQLLARLLGHSGLHVFAYRGYQSVIRGGNVWQQVRASPDKLYSYGDSIDVLIALTKDSLESNMRLVAKNGIVVYDSKVPGIEEAARARQDVQAVSMPLTDMAVQSGGSFIYRNSVAIGFVCKLIGVDRDVIDKAVANAFRLKPDIVKPNVDAVNLGYGFESNVALGKKIEIASAPKARYLIDGNEALALGAYAAGCKFYAAYPMTPASSILEWFAKHENLGVLFKQTEDEIAAINMTMCGTSGGGFSLMVEALGLAGMIEAPIVVVESQRSGPSTGLPTKTEQGDLLFVMHASQGEFPRIVVAPRSIEECFYVGANAFNLAEKYQCPVIVLMDLFLSEHMESIDMDQGRITVDRGLVVTDAPKDGRFKRYALTENGISPRSIPGTKGNAFVAASDEHDEYGNLISDVLVGLEEYTKLRKRMHDKRMHKLDTMLNDGTIEMPLVVNSNADIFIVTFGSTTESATEALQLLNAQGANAGMISFAYLLPMDAGKVKALLSGKRLVDVECNATAQLAKVIEMNTGIEIKDRVLKYDGEAITASEIAEGVLGYAKR